MLLLPIQHWFTTEDGQTDEHDKLHRSSLCYSYRSNTDSLLGLVEMGRCLYTWLEEDTKRLKCCLSYFVMNCAYVCWCEHYISSSFSRQSSSADILLFTWKMFVSPGEDFQNIWVTASNSHQRLCEVPSIVGTWIFVWSQHWAPAWCPHPILTDNVQVWPLS